MNANLTASTDAAVAAAGVLADALPTSQSLTVRLRDAGGTAPSEGAWLRAAVVATFVGGRSYDVALAVKPGVVPTDAGGDGVADLALEDVVQTSLTDAVGRFGDGVLSGLHLDDATALFADPDTIIVELRHASDGVQALFAVRHRAVAGRPASDEDLADRLGRINGVEMALTVQIGRTRMAVRDVLGLEPGAIVELDRSAGSPADILLNGRLIAHGEVVVVDQDYAVRITSILDVADAAA
ncbi:flagellar motor switch protein FliN [Gryllotalpicola sp.]|uniref:flagellar motor switch protein FliN n=1 Tax=Gryllotalpicola sp. TaxID=1932787 RepID=UPI002627046C|nr:flagellar motor switch protein FliN [Gryllotalpicola sp.]